MAGSIPITLDRERQLRLDFNALSDADEVAGKSVDAFFTGSAVSLNAVRALLWAGLKAEEPRLTLRQTGELIQQRIESGEDNIQSLSTKIFEAINAAGFGKKAASQKNGGPGIQS